MLVSVQTPPHHSWKNPAERCMSNLNLGLQGVGVMRRALPTMEQKIKSTNNIKAIRELSNKEPALREEVMDAVQPAKILLGDVFSRLQVKGQNFKVFTAASKDDMVRLVNHLKKIDEEFNTDSLLDSSKPCKLTQKLKDFISEHCVCGQYQLSIKRCGAEDCVCGAPRTSPDTFADLHHLPFPIPQQEKYIHFEDLYGKEEAKVENYVPSKMQRAAQRHSMPFSPSSQKAKNAKMVVQCGECLKWRVCYSARVLKPDQRQKLERALDGVTYSCGTCFQNVSTDDDDSIFNAVYVNDKLTCDLPIEARDYVTFDDPLCYYCGSEDDLITGNSNYPLCNECNDAGKQPRKKNTRAFQPRQE
ncbi:LOW QUALITY PROTEIN: uncharacterized protein [Amphiura filiformis]|uniref:LOW QUALITY PROTEIN: uncharacterized protein n=1 Tax=Amphiura filiformis TaxID=82378 RepID=UPI003B22132B